MEILPQLGGGVDVTLGGGALVDVEVLPGFGSGGGSGGGLGGILPDLGGILPGNGGGGSGGGLGGLLPGLGGILPGGGTGGGLPGVGNLLGGLVTVDTRSGVGIDILPGLAGGVGVDLDDGSVGVDILPGLLGVDLDVDLNDGLDIDLGVNVPQIPDDIDDDDDDNGGGDDDDDPTNGDNGDNNDDGSGIGNDGWTPASPNVRLDLMTAYQNVTRLDPTSSKAPAGELALVNAFKTAITAGTMTTQQAVDRIIDFADGTTSVAILTYQFFTGQIPSAKGLDYLVNTSDELNPFDLTDSYYANFNLENRYINFSAALGLAGESAKSFALSYGDMTFAQAARSIYDQVIGIQEARALGVDTDAAIANIVGRKAYFDELAATRINNTNVDLGAKAALVGYILAEAVKADVGKYANSLENFYYDLADGQAQFKVGLVAAYNDDGAWMA
ncbi:hypothetical protein P7B02_04990 [Caulobacter segnis]|uniref:hypothetical protein n=1 Tax=Caulobacter segnis TaxID=88688 RepID=UPI00240EFE65|nr:hypothetical protein [Caulobacter segnis]MDG2520892.1 hypothetical protein [Caulobacter segnis]